MSVDFHACIFDICGMILSILIFYFIYFIHRSTLDRHTGSIDQSFNSNLKVQMARTNAYLSVIETILKGSSSFSPARRYV